MNINLDEIDELIQRFDVLRDFYFGDLSIDELDENQVILIIQQFNLSLCVDEVESLLKYSFDYSEREEQWTLNQENNFSFKNRGRQKFFSFQKLIQWFKQQIKKPEQIFYELNSVKSSFMNSGVLAKEKNSKQMEYLDSMSSVQNKNGNIQKQNDLNQFYDQLIQNQKNSKNNQNNSSQNQNNVSQESQKPNFYKNSFQTSINSSNMSELKESDCMETEYSRRAFKEQRKIQNSDQKDNIFKFRETISALKQKNQNKENLNTENICKEEFINQSRQIEKKLIQITPSVSPCFFPQSCYKTPQSYSLSQGKSSRLRNSSEQKGIGQIQNTINVNKKEQLNQDYLGLEEIKENNLMENNLLDSILDGNYLNESPTKKQFSNKISNQNWQNKNEIQNKIQLPEIQFNSTIRNNQNHLNFKQKHNFYLQTQEDAKMDQFNTINKIQDNFKTKKNQLIKNKINQSFDNSKGNNNFIDNLLKEHKRNNSISNNKNLLKNTNHTAKNKKNQNQAKLAFYFPVF